MGRIRAGSVCAALVWLGAISAQQQPFRVYPSMERYDDVPLPADYQEKTEFVFGRLMYPNHPQAMFSRRNFFPGDYKSGGTSWTQDYPRADRFFCLALRRLTRLHVRSVEQPIDLDDGDDVFYYPWMFAGEMGDWRLTDAQAAKLREYLLRGGFLMLDDFWGEVEWERFAQTMHRVFPDRPMVDLDGGDAIFHTAYSLDQRLQVHGRWGLNQRRGGWMARRAEGAIPYWRAIYDDHQRIVAGIVFNSDLGDGWEWADDASYPEAMTSFATRLGVNYVIYAMTH
jgi:hypothetical protein